jgi:hypothetical protein
MHNSEYKPNGYIDRSPAGFAKRQGISISTVYKELRSGRLKAKKLGRRTHITEKAEKDWQDSLPDYPISTWPSE